MASQIRQEINILDHATTGATDDIELAQLDTTQYNGTVTYYWAKVYSHYYYAKDTSIVSFDDHKDTDILKVITSKVVKQKDASGKLVDRQVIDVASLPQQLVETSESGNKFVSLAGMSGLQLGILKELTARLEKLEGK